MKNKKTIVFLASLLVLTSCNTVTTISSGDTTPTSSTSIDEKEGQPITYTLKLKNILDGFVLDAEVYINDELVNPSIDDDTLSIETVYHHDNVLKIKHSKYEDIEMPLKDLDADLGTLSLDYKFGFFGELSYNSSLSCSDFKAYSTRGLNYLRFEFVSDRNAFQYSENEIHLYVNTHKTSYKLTSDDYLFKLRSEDFIVYDYGFVHDFTNVNEFNYSVKYVDDKTVVNFDIPYSYLNIRYADVIGVNYLEYLADRDVEVPMIFDEKVIDVNDTKTYARINAKNDYFANTVNEDNPKWISKSKKRELTKDKLYSFADPYYNAHAEADDVYFSLDYSEESLDFDFVGFGTFTDREYFKLVIHNDIIDGQSWNLVDNDIMINIYKDHYDVYYGANTMFAVEQTNLQPTQSRNFNTYVDYTNHFTMNISIPTSLITNINSVYDDIYIMILEFGDNGVFYEGKDINNNFFYDGITLGDPAFMTSYKCVDAPQKRVCNLTQEEKQAIIGNRNINFADPIDVKFEKADDFYMKTTRTDSTVELDMVGFGDFSDTEILTFVLHTSSIDGSSWAIQTSDVSLMISNKEAAYVTGTTDYWVATRMSRAQKKAANPVEYVRYDNYFTLKFVINYEEINLGVGKTTEITTYPIEFGFGGVIYNSDPWTLAMRLNGEPCGDPAFQSYYIAI